MKAILMVLVVAAALVVSGCTFDFDERGLDFETLSKWHNSGQHLKKNYVITTQDELEDILGQVLLQESMPEVDFSKDIVLLVFQGRMPSGGHNVEITGVVEQYNYVEVFVKYVSPGEGCTVTAAVTSPYHAVKIADTGKQIVFRLTEIVDDCTGGNVITGGFYQAGVFCDEESGCPAGTNCFDYQDVGPARCVADPCQQCPSGQCDVIEGQIEPPNVVLPRVVCK